MSDPARAPSPVKAAMIGQLCLACGLCCDGTLFKDVELQPGEDAGRLQAAGLKLETLLTKTRFAQPCAALGTDCRCSVYADRPRRCREFDCALLKATGAGAVAVEAALRIIRATRKKADRVRRLLRELGDADESLPLSKRFRRTARRIENETQDGERGSRFADLSVAMHQLNLVAQARFHTQAEMESGL